MCLPPFDGNTGVEVTFCLVFGVRLFETLVGFVCLMLVGWSNVKPLERCACCEPAVVDFKLSRR